MATINRPFNIILSSNLSLNGQTIDASESNQVSWEVSGDIQTAYQVDIFHNVTGNNVYSSGKITSYNLTHTIPANSIANGNDYQTYVTSYNKDDISMPSFPEIFTASSRPRITVSTIGTVGNFSNEFYATYIQDENVPMRNWTANLYNAQQQLIDHSDIMTDSVLQYLFSNLETETSYYVEFQATSEKGLIGTSGLIPFDVFYLRPKQHLTLTANNIVNAGLELSWFVTQVVGKSNNTVSFINNEEVDLTNNMVYFDNGFNIAQDFSLKVWLRNFDNNVPLLTLKGDNGQIVLKYNAVLDSFILTKTANVISDGVMSDELTQYTFITPYQIDVVSGSKAVVLIQQIGMDINLEQLMYD